VPAYLSPYVPTGSSPTEQLFACSREDIARLAPILRELSCGALMRDVDGTVLPLAAADGLISQPRSTGECTLSVPIYGAEGEPLAFLDAAPGDNGSDGLRRLLRMLIEPTVRAIAERWFRICYRGYWIVAAQRRDGPGTRILLAVDCEQRLAGADRHARQILEARGRHVEPNLTLSAFFQIGAVFFHERRDYDVGLRLVGLDDVPWSVLITPPAVGAAQSHNAESLLTHARPRQDTITCIGDVAPHKRKHCGLSPRKLKRVKEYIDSRCNSALPLEELTAMLDLSVSHFARSFRQSVGLTPHRYVFQRRLLRAQQLIAQTDLALVDIALKTGFADQSHLSRRFHELTGLPPRAFREQHR